LQRAAQIRILLEEDNMPVDEAPEDDEGEGAPRASYNFAPGYHGVVYRADVPDWGAGPRRQHQQQAQGAGTSRPGSKGDAGASATAEQEEDEEDEGAGAGGAVAAETKGSSAEEQEQQQVHYKLQAMKWGLVPFWTKRNPDYGSMLKTINCRDDSLSQGAGGMWTTMKARKRCIVVAQGFYEWLKKDGSRDKLPHFVKRKDGALMCFAGLWDCVQYESEFLDFSSSSSFPDVYVLYIFYRCHVVYVALARRSTGGFCELTDTAPWSRRGRKALHVYDHHDGLE
jgi:putative SOS response-associated peptidase YedK